jgi:F-type H+-transporting ATPase subunit a
MASETVIQDTAARSKAVEEYILHHVGNTPNWHLPGLFDFDLPGFSMHALMLMIAGGLLLYLFLRHYDPEARIPGRVGNFLEIFVLFVRNEIAINCLGEEDGRKMTPLFCGFFFFILTLNLLGLVPIFAGATANVNVTGGLAAVTLFFMIFGSMYRHGVAGFFGAFAPHGVPWPVLILLVPLEITGLFIKAFALTIRLFANMFAGHVMISALVGLVVVYGIAAAPAIGLAVAIYFLKILVAFLQAYIFTLLSAMFIGQTLNPAH